MSDQAIEQELEHLDSAVGLAAAHLLEAVLRLGATSAHIPTEQNGVQYLVTVSLPGHCGGKNCHAVSGSADTNHSLECQEETTYTYAGEPKPETLDCEKAVEARWAAIQPKAAD